MKELCRCVPGVTKRGYRLLVSLIFLFQSTKGLAQDDTTRIMAPYGPLTYNKALSIIAKQLKVMLSHDPVCPELSGNCPKHGRMTFERFFEPLKAQGLTYRFVLDDLGQMMLVIKRVKPAQPVYNEPGSFVMWTKDEHGDPLPGVTALNTRSKEMLVSDSTGAIRFKAYVSPAQFFLTYVNRRSVTATILKDSMNFVLEIDPQSLEIAMVSYGGRKKAVSTGGYISIVEDVVSSPYYGFSQKSSGISTATAQTMLEGEATGVLVNETSGIPGSSSYLTVRSQSSIISGTDPLYLIDGVPEAAGNASVSYIQSGIASGTLSCWSFISPFDIERLDVLKDGDATAIYGSRGANGVVLITTRRRKAGQAKWNLAVSMGNSNATMTPAFMNSSEYLAMRREALLNSGLTPDSVNAPDLTRVDTTRNTNWRKWLLGRHARLADIKLAVSGGSRMDNYTVGVNYLKESTPLPTQPDHDRLTTNFNYNHLSRNRRWTLEIAGVSGWDANHQFVAIDPTAFQTLAPDAPSPLDRSGHLNFPPGLPFYNPLTVIRQPYEALSSNNLLSLVTGYQFSTHLHWQTTLGFNHIQIQEYGEMPLGAQNPAYVPQATGFFANTKLDSRTCEPGIEYKTKTGKLEVSLLGGASFQVSNNHSSARVDTGYVNDVALLHHEHAIPEDTSSYATHEVYSALFGNLNANWGDRYVLNLTARRDESSRFPVNQRFGNFGAVAFAWIFSDVTLIQRRLSFVSYGKIKLSDGVTGNNQMGDRSQQNIAGTSIESFQSIAGLYPSNPTGTGWTKTYKTELALDLGFLQNRILFNVSTYRHRIDNLVQTGAAPMGRSGLSTSGWPVVLENSGYEFFASAKVADNSSFGWDISVNWTIPKSKLVSFPQLANSPYDGRLIVGQSINVLKGYVYRGVDRQTGLYSFADINHDGKITEADKKIVGRFDVTGFGGFENLIRWKQFQLQALIDVRFATGVNYLSAILADNPPGTISLGLSSNVPKAFLSHWRHPGDHASYQKVYAIPDVNADSTLNLYLNSSALLANTSFVRLRKLSIAYNLPPIKSMVMHLTSLTIFLDAQNLIIFSPYKADVEIQSLLTMPTMRTVEVGIRLTH